ncbi:hypothetical protein BJF79_16300 [Actinomadura sp. CNU-125]|uniref:TetR/AcrR family transcriptional regulator C-terminal domain-containing protein n=1 Tax=Actinomadura sp. CNU-125 TaxID=1904961 RepID=UPI000969721D|nr:TetR/AcrR family transcriptional regulator C-terminal domain-containing protein [Actinomadura sp. CNU-125]OLT20298.1 hypothetical protein BJF79_16300 [Actinomadura sp. CNU-125]
MTSRPVTTKFAIITRPRSPSAKLDVRSPALYWHFRNKQELVDAMARAVQARHDLGPPHEGEPWRDRLVRRARERRRVLPAHRDGARLVAGTSPGPSIVTAFDRELAALVRQGFAPIGAMRAITAIGAFVTGFVLEEQAHEARPDEPVPSPDAAAETPTLMAAIGEGGSPDGPAAFEDGLPLLLNGIEAAHGSAAAPYRR